MLASRSTLATTPITQNSDASRIALGNLAKEARQQLEFAGLDKRRLASLMVHFDDLADDVFSLAFCRNSSPFVSHAGCAQYISPSKHVDTDG